MIAPLAAGAQQGIDRPMRRFCGYHSSRIYCCAAVLVASWLGGCGDHQEPNEIADAARISSTATAGPTTLTLTLAPKELTVGDRARLSVELVSQPGVTVRVDDYLPVLLEGDRRFEMSASLAAKTEAEPIQNGQLRWLYLYDLSFILPGDYELPSATASFVDMRDGAAPSSEDPETQIVATESIAIAVRGLREQPLTPEEFADIKMPDPVELRRPVSPWAWLVAVGAVLALGLIAHSVRRRRASGGATVVIGAHEWAHQQLAALLADDLIEKGLAQEFYYRISAIVRGYIERRFGVSAPDMTTEEFLAAAGGDARFVAEHTTSLNAFLTACDLVKYARHEPTSVEAEQAVKTAIAFVEQTRVRSDHAEQSQSPSDALEARAS